MKIQLAFGGLLLVAVPLIAQSNFDVDSFLSTFRTAESMIFQQEKVRYLAHLPHRMRSVEKLDVRTETNEFDWKQQEYLLRLSPNSRNKIKSHQRYYRTIQNMTEMELEQTMGEALKTRYDLVVDYIYIQQVLDAKEKLNDLYKDKVTLLNRSMTLSNFSVLDLLDAEDENQVNVRDILDLKNELLAVRKIMQRLIKSDSDFVLTGENLMTVDQLKKIVQDVKPYPAVTHPKLKVQLAKLNNSMLEYDREAANAKFSISYIQANYGYQPNDSFRQSFSIGIGFEIPLNGAANLELNELLINKMESENDYRNLEIQLENEKYILLGQLENRFQKYELVRQQLEEGAAEFVIQSYSKLAEASPSVLLKLRENTLNNELLLKKLEWDLYQNYLDYLHLTGVLSQLPLKNYLLERQSRF